MKIIRRLNKDFQPSTTIQAAPPAPVPPVPQQQVEIPIKPTEEPQIEEIKESLEDFTVILSELTDKVRIFLLKEEDILQRTLAFQHMVKSLLRDIPFDTAYTYYFLEQLIALKDQLLEREAWL